MNYRDDNSSLPQKFRRMIHLGDATALSGTVQNRCSVSRVAWEWTVA